MPTQLPPAPPWSSTVAAAVAAVVRDDSQNEFHAVITLLQLRFEKISPKTFVETWLPGNDAGQGSFICEKPSPSDPSIIHNSLLDTSLGYRVYAFKKVPHVCVGGRQRGDSTLDAYTVDYHRRAVGDRGVETCRKNCLTCRATCPAD